MKKVYPHPKKEFQGISFKNILNISDNRYKNLLSNIPKYYLPIELKKKDGTIRNINAPNKYLKEKQKLILNNLLEKIKLPRCVFGGLKGKSIIENAKQHINNDYLFNIDIKSFFPSVHWKIINKLFLDLGFCKEVSMILNNLTTLNYCLPQGAPTSPYLANLVLTNLDYRLYNLCKNNRLIYTRYFDDISVSGDKRIELLKEIFFDIINEEGYKVKKEKTYFYKPGEIKKITGILIKNRELFIDDEKLLKYIISVKRNGLSYLKSANFVKEKQSLIGKINFIKSVNLERGKILEKEFKLIKWV